MYRQRSTDERLRDKTGNVINSPVEMLVSADVIDYQRFPGTGDMPGDAMFRIYFYRRNALPTGPEATSKISSCSLSLNKSIDAAEALRVCWVIFIICSSNCVMRDTDPTLLLTL